MLCRRGGRRDTETTETSGQDGPGAVAAATDRQRSHVEQIDGPEKRQLAAACQLMARQQERTECQIRCRETCDGLGRDADSQPQRRAWFQRVLLDGSGHVVRTHQAGRDDAFGIEPVVTQ